jgi:hypothetical protein
MRDIARLLWMRRRPLEPILYRKAHHQESHTHRSAMLLLVVSGRGQKGVNAYTLGWSHGAVTPMNSGLSGQVGQESNLQPAVVEVAALRPIPSCPVLSCRIFPCVHRSTVPYSPVSSRGIAATFAARRSISLQSRITGLEDGFRLSTGPSTFVGVSACLRFCCSLYRSLGCVAFCSTTLTENAFKTLLDLMLELLHTSEASTYTMFVSVGVVLRRTHPDKFRL